ncbi:MAG: DUF1566 domain-containing protein [Thiothrix sp.]
MFGISAFFGLLCMVVCNGLLYRTVRQSNLKVLCLSVFLLLSACGGSAGTGSAGTGSADTGSADTGSADTGSAGISEVSGVVQPTPTGRLNDTGITTDQCGNNSANAACPQPGFPQQDGEIGRDANQATNNDADGHRGFSFTKISSTGAELPADAAAWSCVKDNVTGLIWEVKTNDGGLHDKDDRYSWYGTDAATNGGIGGYKNDDGNTCYGHNVTDSATYCNTGAYVNRVNRAGWCGAKDWRMPTLGELQSIVDLSRYDPTIDTTYFPNTVSSWYWSGTPSFCPVCLVGEWAINFYYGNDSIVSSVDNRVRLVRSAQ